MKEQSNFPCRATWKTTVDCPVCGKCMQLKTLKYAHRATCAGPAEHVIANAKEDALNSFTRSFEPPVQHHFTAPESTPQQDYSHLLSHLLA